MEKLQELILKIITDNHYGDYVKSEQLVKLFEVYHISEVKKLNKSDVMRSVCDDWIHNERIKMNDDKYCPICGKKLQAN